MQRHKVTIGETVLMVFQIDGFYYAKIADDMILMGREFPDMAACYKALYRYKAMKQAAPVSAH